MPKPRLLIADDHRLVAHALSRMLRTRYEIVGVVHDGRELLDVVPRLQPDIIIIDVTMPHVDGLAACRALRRKFREVRLVVVTMHEEPELAISALRAGAQAFLLKSDGVEVFSEALETALQDQTYVSPAIRQEVARRLNTRDADVALTPRQLEILTLLGQGLPMKKVASRLDITPRTVAFHKYRIMKRCGIDSSAGLVRLAIQHGLIAPPT